MGAVEGEVAGSMGEAVLAVAATESAMAAGAVSHQAVEAAVAEAAKMEAVMAAVVALAEAEVDPLGK